MSFDSIATKDEKPGEASEDQQRQGVQQRANRIGKLHQLPDNENEGDAP